MKVYREMEGYEKNMKGFDLSGIDVNLNSVFLSYTCGQIFGNVEKSRTLFDCEVGGDYGRFKDLAGPLIVYVF